jgi:hypothetical protein
MGGEIFCIVVPGTAVPHHFPVLASKSDARMAQTGFQII